MQRRERSPLQQRGVAARGSWIGLREALCGKPENPASRRLHFLRMTDQACAFPCASSCCQPLQTGTPG